jgi:hypothetical protein
MLNLQLAAVNFIAVHPLLRFAVVIQGTMIAASVA